MVSSFFQFITAPVVSSVITYTLAIILLLLPRLRELQLLPRSLPHPKILCFPPLHLPSYHTNTEAGMDAQREEERRGGV